MDFQIITKSENETKKTAKEIASFFQCGDLILLDGDMGTGKTYFVKGFAEGLGSIDNVTSPTFSIANFYKTENWDILHIDLYRISTILEFSDLGISDYFPQSIVLIEWGKKFADYFSDYVLISIEYFREEKEFRKMTFTCKGDKYTSTINLLNHKLLNPFSC